MMATKKQAKEGCTSERANPNSTDTAGQIRLQCPCNFGNTGLSQVLLHLYVFPTTVVFYMQPAKRTLAGATLHLKFKVSK